MKSFLPILLLSALVSRQTFAQGTPVEEAMASGATERLQAADAAHNKGDSEEAAALYREARTEFLRIRKLNPSYKSDIIELRLEHCNQRLEPVTVETPVSPVPPQNNPVPPKNGEVDYKARYDQLIVQARVVAKQARSMRQEVEAARILGEENEELKQVVQELHQQLSDANTVPGSHPFAKERAALMEKNQTLSSEIIQLRNTREGHATEELQKRLASTEQALEDAYAKAGGSPEDPSLSENKELQELRKSYAALEEEKNRIQKDADAFRARSTPLMDQLAAEFKELQKQFEEKNSELSEAHRTLEGLPTAEAMQTLNATLAKVQKEAAAVQNEFEQNLLTSADRNTALVEQITQTSEALRALRLRNADQIRSLEGSLAGTQQSNQVWNVENQELREQLEAALATVSKEPHETGPELPSADVEKMEAEASALRTALAEAATRIKSLEQVRGDPEKLISLEEAYRTQASVTETRSAELARCTEDLEMLRTEHQNLLQSVHSHTSHLAILQMDLQEANTLAGDLEAQAARVEEFQKSLTEESMAHRKTKQNMLRLKDYIQELRDQVTLGERQRNKQNDLIEHLQDTDEQRKVAEAELRTLGFDLKDAATREQQAKADMASLKDFVKKLGDEKVEQKAIIEDMAKELADQRNVLPELKKELETRHAALNAATAKEATLTKELQESAHQLERLKPIEQAFNENQKQFAALEKKYSELAEAYGKLKKEHAEAQDGAKIAANLHEQSRALEKFSEELEADNASLADNIRELENELNGSRKRSEEMHDQVKSLEKEKEQLRKKLEKASETES